MNSWHSFSPNGRWLVFSSKSRSPYTQMFLTHIDEEGNDSPAILIENATAANRAVNIPEFVNIPPDGLLKIDAPATDYYRAVDLAAESLNNKRYEESIPEWRRALELSPNEALPHTNLGVALAETGKFREAIAHYQKALELSPRYADAHNNLGEAFARSGNLDEAIAHFEKALQIDPGLGVAHSNLGAALVQKGRIVPQSPTSRRPLKTSLMQPMLTRYWGSRWRRRGDTKKRRNIWNRRLSYQEEVKSDCSTC